MKHLLFLPLLYFTTYQKPGVRPWELLPKKTFELRLVGEEAHRLIMTESIIKKRRETADALTGGKYLQPSDTKVN